MENPPPLAGLNPADLLRQGVAEDTFMEGTPTSFNPPPITELAPLFPQFEILELIGKGGMGAVYKVRQRDLDRIVALKILPPAIGQSPAFSSRFTREAKALAKLNHPGIVTIHEFGQRDGLYFFLMEFVDGVNLAQLMKTGRVSPREALAIVPQICDALQFAHDQGIVHRDIKPENILLDRLGRVKVADFGIAKLVGADEPSPAAHATGDSMLTEAGKVIGTPQYMAPEQIEHPSEVDHRADIYALGVVFYQMLTGELPGNDFQSPSRKVSIDVRLDEIVLQAMEKNPELRFQQARVMKTRVETIGKAEKQEGASAASRENIRQSLRKPAIGLIASGILQLFACLSLIGFALPAVGREGGDFGGYVAVYFMAGLSFLAAAVVLSGATGMLRLRRYQLAVTASVVAMIAGPAAILGLPFGIWALRVLNRREVRETFEITSPIPTADRATRLIKLFLLYVPALLAITFAIRAIFQQPLVVTGSRAEPEIPLKQAGQSKRILEEYHWAQLAAEGRIFGGVPVEVDGRDALKIENPKDTPLQLTLLKIETPPTTGIRYAVSGEIKYEGVRGAGHLEMWSQFPQGRFFTRTLGAPGSGPMSQLAGTSGWREFSLPFDRTGTTSPPAQLEVNIFLPGRGTVFIGPLKLTESESTREKVGRAESRATHGDQVAVKDLALQMPESSIQERLVDLEIAALVARKKFLTTAPEFKQAALAVAEFTRENPSARDGNYGEVLEHRRKSIADLRVKLATEYGAQHPRMLEQGYELEAVEHLIRTTNTRVIRKTDPSVRGRMKFHFDCGGDTMQFMTMRFRRQYGVRVCYESAELNRTEWMDLNTMEDVLAGLEVKEASAGLTEREKERLTEVRRYQSPENIRLSEKYYSGEIAATSLEDFFNQLTKDTPYRWRSSASGGTWVILPKTGSRLDFPVTLDARDLTVEEAFEKACLQSLAGRILLYPRPQNPPFEMVPWRDVKAPPLRFNQQPAWEVLCQIGEQAEPDSVWDLTGPLVINPGNDSVHENGVTFTAQQWLAGIDAGNYAQSWKDAAAFFQNSITEVGWSDAMEKFRKPLGALISRKLLKAQSAKSLPGAPDGDYVVMQFESSFAAKNKAVETVTFGLEKDGTWRAVGYFIR